MKYLTKITKKNFQFSCDTRISLRTAISAIFEAGNQVKFSKTLHLHSCHQLPPATDTTPGKRCDFVVVRHGSIVVVHMSWFMSWFKPLTRKPVGFMQSCCFVFNGSETKTCLLCNSYLFGMNNVLYIEYVCSEDKM